MQGTDKLDGVFHHDQVGQGSRRRWAYGAYKGTFEAGEGTFDC